MWFGRKKKKENSTDFGNKKKRTNINELRIFEHVALPLSILLIGIAFFVLFFLYCFQCILVVVAEK